MSEVAILREKLGMSQTDLSDSFGVNGRDTISRWETGRRKPGETIRRLVCLLNDLPKKDALDFVKKLGQYKQKRR